MTSYIEMTMEEWEATFKPINNHLDENASFQNEDGEGIMFETYGEEIDFVKSQPVANIWTYTSGESNTSWINNGWGFINRLGYFITELPCPPDTEIAICVEEPNYLCPNCEEQHWGEAGELHYEKFSDLEKCVACATMEELKELENEPTTIN
jgi:hypothetical protein